MKVLVFTDVHANLPALRAFAAAARKEGYDAAFHTGDAVGIGPWPAETLDLLGELPRLHLIAGNHDSWMCSGIPRGSARWLEDHYRWLAGKVSRAQVNFAAAWPYLTEHDFGGVRAAFVHYALRPCGRQVSLPISARVPADLDALIGRHSSLLVFHGHRHKASDVKGKVRYLNPGSLGCWYKPAARFAIARFHKGKVTVQHRAVPYDREELIAGFSAEKVPDAARILESYFSR